MPEVSRTWSTTIDRAVLLRFDGRRPQVRQAITPAAEQGATRKIGDVGLDACAASAASTASSSTSPSRAKFRQNGARFATAALRVEEVARDVEERHVQRDEVGLLQDFSMLCARLTPSATPLWRRP